MKPLLVRQIEEGTDSPIIERFDPEQQCRVMSRATARRVKDLLRLVVADGSGRKASVDGYQVAGKTGTAQKTDPSTGRYYLDRHVAVFCGFVPVDEPRLTILVLVDSPRVEHDTGGAVAAPVFAQVAEASLNYLRVPPDQPATLVAKKDVTNTEKAAPKKETLVNLDIASSAMPDLTGMSKLDVVETLSSLPLKVWSLEGSGHVVWQSLAPGQQIASGDECRIIFAKDRMSDETFRFTQAGGSELR